MKCPINYKEGILNIPGLIADNLGVEWKRKFDISLGKRIIWIVIDGLGYYELKREKFIFNSLKNFKIRRTYSVFPSSTVPALSIIEKKGDKLRFS